jgi:hypothetical protein
VNLTGIVGLAVLLAFFFILIAFSLIGRKRPAAPLREIPAFSRLNKAIGLAVESGKRMHLTLGRGKVADLEAASALVGLDLLERVARSASVSDRPPVSTSGDGLVAVLSQDTLRRTYRSIGAASQFNPSSGQMSGITPFSYAAGTLPVMYDEHVSATVFSGHFGSEVALISDAAERTGGFTIGGSDSLPAQAVLYASVQEALIGEELYAAGAYMKSTPIHNASLRTQDILRWVLVIVMVAGAFLKFLGFL